MAKKKQQQAHKRAPKAPDQTKGAPARMKQQHEPPYLALLANGTQGPEKDVEVALQALETLTEEPEAFVAPPPELAQVCLFECAHRMDSE
jgi:hypothetical protein